MSSIVCNPAIEKAIFARLLVLTLFFLITASFHAQAKDFSLTGDITHQIQRTAYSDGSLANNIETTVHLYTDWRVRPKVSLFSRYGYEHFGGDEGETAPLSSLDQFGVKYIADQHNVVSVGKQGAYMGVYSGLISVGGSVGQGMLTGIDIQHTSADHSIHMLAGHLDKRLFSETEKKDVAAWGLEWSGTLGKNRLSAGFLSLDNTKNNYYSLGAVHSQGKAQLMAECVGSTASTQHTGIIYGASYSLSENDGISITAHYLEENASAPGVGGYTNDTASTVFSWGHSWPEGYVSVSYEKVHNLSDQSRYHTTTLAYVRSW